MNTLLLILIGFLLLVLVVFYWLQFRAQEESDVSEDRRVYPLLRGINFLLSEEPDRAVQEMVKVARLNSEAVDVYMSLGEMFRKNGEIGRAVRIHQNILARPDASEKVYIQAQYALAKDFQTGGLLDRALKHYQKVLDVDSAHIPALKAALRIREISHEWLEAEALLSRIERIQSDDECLHRSYLIAETAELALNSSDLEQAKKLAGEALNVNRTCIHAYDILLRIAVLDQDKETVQTFGKEIAERIGEFCAVFVPVLINDQFNCQDVLVGIWNNHHDEELALTMIEHVAVAHGADAAKHLKNDVLNYSTENLRSLLRLAAVGISEDQSIKSAAKPWRLAMKRYTCGHCGVKVVDMRWQCPQCHEWGTMSFVRESS